MESGRANCIAFAAVTFGILLWTTGGVQTAPMECHFDSRAQCVFQGRNYTLGETWMDHACMLCTCLHPVGVGCCETIHRPVDFPAGCEVRVEAVTCRVSLVQVADSRLPCFSGDYNHFLDPSHGSMKLGE